ncbi:putative glucan endo-1,3-beta-glucosidase A-like [Capsicum annuum]|nr:putative glucan endo-1,3-beta-glucosidase A-like [Capsicum annuum]KAF3663448.1 putative glucan endo-1,3-beta-glucosidase A-like [Capsicum annuum]
MSVEDLIVILYIEKDNKAVEKRSKGNSTISGANIMEDNPNNSKKWKKASGQQSNPPKKKFKGKCLNCGKVGRKSVDCRAPKKFKKKDRANMAETKNKMDDLYPMLSK